MDRPVRGAAGWPLMPNPEILTARRPSVSSGDNEGGVACKIQRSCSSVPKKLRIRSADVVVSIDNSIAYFQPLDSSAKLRLVTPGISQCFIFCWAGWWACDSLLHCILRRLQFPFRHYPRRRRAPIVSLAILGSIK